MAVTGTKRPAVSKKTTVEPAGKTPVAKQDVSQPFETRLSQAINQKDVMSVLQILSGASPQELMNIAQNKTIMNSLQDLSENASKSLWDRAVDKFCDKASKAGAWIANNVLGRKGTKFVYDAMGAANTVRFDLTKIMQHRDENSAALTAKDSPLTKATKTRYWVDKEKNISTAGGYIENQSSGGWDKIKYGNYDLKHAGCGVFATYNALHALGEKPDLVEIMTYYELTGLVANGKFGTTPDAVEKYLKAKGHNVKMTTNMTPSNLDQMGRKHQAFIALSMNNKATLSDGGHYVGISKEGSATNYKFELHNAGNHKRFATLSEAVSHVGDNPFTFCLLGVDKKLKK